jgi:hypothetical protein
MIRPENSPVEPFLVSPAGRLVCFHIFHCRRRPRPVGSANSVRSWKGKHGPVRRRYSTIRPALCPAFRVRRGRRSPCDGMSTHAGSRASGYPPDFAPFRRRVVTAADRSRLEDLSFFQASLPCVLWKGLGKGAKSAGHPTGKPGFGGKHTRPGLSRADARDPWRVGINGAQRHGGLGADRVGALVPICPFGRRRARRSGRIAGIDRANGRATDFRPGQDCAIVLL